MATERETMSPQEQRDHDDEEETGEVVDRRRPRRRFRGFHWRHASQSYTPPSPSNPAPAEPSPPRLRPLSLSHGLSAGLDFSVSDSPATPASTVANVNPETPTSAGSYSYRLLVFC